MMTEMPVKALWRQYLPSRLERQRLLRMWIRWRRDPQCRRCLPRCWRREFRLAFWWQLAVLLQDHPWTTLAALAVPWVWLLRVLLGRWA
jgi:hypothetical protein